MNQGLHFTMNLGLPNKKNELSDGGSSTVWLSQLQSEEYLLYTDRLAYSSSSVVSNTLQYNTIIFK